MSGPERIERDLERLLREDPAPGQLDDLDAKVGRLIAAGHPTGAGRRRVWRVLGTAAATMLVAAIAVVALGGRPDGVPAAMATPPPTVRPAGDTPSPASSPAPTPAPTVEATVVPSPSAVADPTDEPTGEPSDRPTQEPTRNPTPKPTREPQPGGEEEPTPRTYVGSGSLGSPLTVHGATLLMSRTDVPAVIGDVCARQGWETWAYNVHLSWKNPAGDVEPYFVAGEHKYHAIWWETRWQVNTDQITVVCHKPGDSARVRAETTPDGVPLTTYIWKFTP